MSYWLHINDQNGETIKVNEPHFLAGGTYVYGGTTELSLNVTYNYGEFYDRMMPSDGLMTLHGKSVNEALPIVEKAIAELGDEAPTQRYWDATAGNAVKALRDIRELMLMAPHGVVSVS